MGERVFALGHADHLAGLKGRGGNAEGTRIRQPNILGGADDETSSDEAGLLPSFEHEEEPVERGIRIATADGFDEGRSGVVMVVAAVVITNATFTGKRSHGVVGDGTERRRGKDQGLETVQRATEVARSHLGHLLQHFLRCLDAEGTEASFLVRERGA